MLSSAELRTALDEAVKSHRRAVLIPYKAIDSTVNEYCLFLKPELTSSAQTFPAIMDLVLERLNAFAQRPVAALALDAAFLERHRIMAQHYGVIDSISRDPSRISPEAEAKLEATFGEEIHELDRIGAHQFLAQYPFFTAQALAVLYDGLKNNKLAGGTHCVKTVVRGRRILLFNGFYPEQLEHYTRPSAAILVFVIRGERSWRDIRQEMTGTTNPQVAAATSIRAHLLRRREELLLSDVSAGRNGVHVSAGPIEAMAEISRYVSDWDSGTTLPAAATTFGIALKGCGISPERIEQLASNVMIDADGKRMPAFDATEELDAAEVIRRVNKIGVAGGSVEH